MAHELQSVVIEVTNHCNARCSYCTHRFMNRKMGFMEEKVFQKIIDDCSKTDSVTRISMTMHGEPTLVKDLVKKLEYIKMKCPKVRVTMATNGSYLTEDVVKLLHNVDISFNYPDREMFNRETGLDFDTIKNRIFSLEKVKDKIAVHYVESKNLKNGLAEIKEIFKDYRVVVNVRFNSWNGRLEDLTVYPTHIRNHCERIKVQLPILWNGDGVVCCNDYEGETSKFIGNVMNSSILDMFNCDYLSEMRERDKSFNFSNTLCEKCNACLEVGNG